MALIFKYQSVFVIYNRIIIVQVDYYNIILFSIEYLMFTNDYLAKLKKNIHTM